MGLRWWLSYIVTYSPSTNSFLTSVVVLRWYMVVPNQIIARIWNPVKVSMSSATYFTSLNKILILLYWFNPVNILVNKKKFKNAASPWWPFEPFPNTMKKMYSHIEPPFAMSARLNISLKYSRRLCLVINWLYSNIDIITARMKKSAKEVQNLKSLLNTAG